MSQSPCLFIYLFIYLFLFIYFFFFQTYIHLIMYYLGIGGTNKIK